MYNYLFGNLAVRLIQIKYETKQIERYFVDYELMKKKIGTEHTITVKKRIDALKASVCFFDFLNLRLGKPHRLKWDLVDCYGISVTGNVRLIVKPVCADHTPQSLQECDVIIMKGVCKYHGDKTEWVIP